MLCQNSPAVTLPSSGPQHQIGEGTNLAMEGLSQQLHRVFSHCICHIEALGPLEQLASMQRGLLHRVAKTEPNHRMLLVLQSPAGSRETTLLLKYPPNRFS